MADTKLHDLTELTVPPAIDDELEILDRSDTTMDADGTNKRIKVQTFMQAIVARTADRAAITLQTTPQSDGVLLFPVTANSTQVLFVELFAIVNTANATMDIKLGWSVPAGASMRWGLGYVAGATFPGFYATATTNTPTTLLTAAGTQTIGSFNNGQQFVGVSGYLYAGGTGGNANWQIAQATSDAGNLIVEKGSFLRVTQLVA